MMKADFLTDEEVLTHLNLTKTQLAQLVFGGQLSPKPRIPPSSSAAQVFGLEPKQIRDCIVEYQSTNDEAKKARLFSNMMGKFAYVLFPAHEVEKLIQKNPSEQQTKLGWDDDNDSVIINGKSEKISKGAHAQLHALPLLIKARGRRVSKQDLLYGVGSLDTFRFDHIMNRINDRFPNLVEGDDEKGYRISKAYLRPIIKPPQNS